MVFIGMDLVLDQPFLLQSSYKKLLRETLQKEDTIFFIPVCLRIFFKGLLIN